MPEASSAPVGLDGGQEFGADMVEKVVTKKKEDREAENFFGFYWCAKRERRRRCAALYKTHDVIDK
jgi:hypothetical protein